MNDIEIPKNYTGEDLTEDYTDVLKKIWDSRIPKKVENVKSFDTIKAIYNKHKKNVGPLNFWEDKLYFRAQVVLNSEPLKDFKIEGDTLTKKQFAEAYGENFDESIRSAMVNLAKFFGVDISQFDLDGIIQYIWND